MILLLSMCQAVRHVPCTHISPLWYRASAASGDPPLVSFKQTWHTLAQKPPSFMASSSFVESTGICWDKITAPPSSLSAMFLALLLWTCRITWFHTAEQWSLFMFYFAACMHHDSLYNRYTVHQLSLYASKHSLFHITSQPLWCYLVFVNNLHVFSWVFFHDIARTKGR